MEPIPNRKQVCSTLARQLTVALLVILSSLSQSHGANDNHQTKAETSTDPSHISWTSANTRYDFVFNIREPIRGLVKLESDPANFLTNSLSHCANHSACLFRNGTYLEAFQVTDATKNSHKSIFTPNQDATKPATKAGNSSRECDSGNKFEIFHYCSTNWNPPVRVARIDCNHIFEWHSPFTCHSNVTNQEHPCYLYGPSGKLIDLTHWILSNGSSYRVDTGGSAKVKQFNLNVCNEAHDACGPNVSACYIDDQLGTVESGYNNMTSIKYDVKDGAVLLTYLGHFKPQCEDSRVKTVIHFSCNKGVVFKTEPKLVRSSACESIIHWPTVYACPTSEVSAPATNCRIKYEPLGIDVDLKKLTNNQTMVEVPDIKIDGTNKKMLLGLCQALPKSLSCEGKSNSQTMACLIDANMKSTIAGNTASNSQIIGSVSKSVVRLTDIDRVYLESFAINKTCSEPVRKDFNVTRKIGTRIEFFCSEARKDRPTFIGYDDCTYIFEWGTPELCPQTMADARKTTSNPTSTTETTTTTSASAKAEKAVPPNIADQIKNVNVREMLKDVNHKVIKKAESPMADMDMVDSASPPPKMNSAHKFFMISLIIMSFAAFIVVIFVLDKKTRLRITLRQARQAFQANHQQPYSRVVSDLDL